MFSPDALKAMLKGFGFDIEPLVKIANEIVASGKAEEILQVAKTLGRIEEKLDALLKKLEANGNGNS